MTNCINCEELITKEKTKDQCGIPHSYHGKPYCNECYSKIQIVCDICGKLINLSKTFLLFPSALKYHYCSDQCMKKGKALEAEFKANYQLLKERFRKNEGSYDPFETIGIVLGNSSLESFIKLIDHFSFQYKAIISQIKEEKINIAKKIYAIKPEVKDIVICKICEKEQEQCECNKKYENETGIIKMGKIQFRAIPICECKDQSKRMKKKGDHAILGERFKCPECNKEIILYTTIEFIRDY